MEDNAPATKADFSLLGATIRHLEEKMDQRFAKVHEDIDRVLTVLVNMDKRLSNVADNHEERIMRLERRVGVVA